MNSRSTSNSVYQHIACIGLGSNLGDSTQTVIKAWKILGQEQNIQLGTFSSLYKTAPVDMSEESRWFVNAAGVISTSLTPENLLVTLLAVEKEFGRKRNNAQGYQNRTLDLDLLLYDDTVMQSLTLHLPHPKMAQRKFVLAPLAEIAPELIHPVHHKNVQDLLKALPADPHNNDVEILKNTTFG